MSGLTGQIERVAAGSTRTRSDTDALARRAARGRRRVSPTSSAPSASSATSRPTCSGSRAISPSRPDVAARRRERAYVALGSNLGDRAGAPANRARRAGRAAGHRTRRRIGHRGNGAARRNGSAALSQSDGRARDRARAASAARRAARDRAAGGAASAADAGAPGPSTSISFDTAIERVAEPDLIIPHPELPNRDFWLRELAELQPMNPDER